MDVSPKILIVDDEVRMCESLKVLLSGQGYVIQTAHSGSEARTYLNKDIFDLVILDVTLPDTEGYSLMGQIDLQDSSPLFIIITGYASVESAIKALRKGAYDYLKKPFEHEELLNTIKNALDHKRLESERIEAEEELYEFEERFRAIAESSPDAIFSTDTTGKIIFWNKAARDMFGFEKREILGKLYSVLMSARIKERIEKRMEEFLEKGAPSLPGKPSESVFLKKDGCEFPGEISMSSWKSKKRMFFSATVRDITERKRAEEELRKSEEKYRTMIESSHEVVFSKDCEGRYHSLNLNAAIGLGGTCIEDIAGKTDDDLLPREQAAALQERDKEVMESGKAIEYEEVVSDTQGQERTYLSRKWPTFDDEGRISGIGCFASDITERKRAEKALAKSEERYRTLTSNIPGVVYRCANDLDWTTEFMSNEIEKIVGYPASDFIKNSVRTASSFIHPDDQQMVYDNVQKALANKQPFELKYRYVHKNGTIKWMHERGCGVWGDNGELNWLDGIYFDITDQKRIEEELILAKKFETMDTFSAGIAHDFNNLLSIILSNIDLSKDDIQKPDDALKFLDEAGETVFKAKNLTDEFLTLSGAGIAYKNTTDPCKLIKDTASRSLKNSSVKCEFTMPEEVWEVKIGPKLLSRIISNVIENSREAMPDGGVLKIRADQFTYKEEENRLPLTDDMYFLISISDNGCGISEKNLPSIFDPYYSTKERGVQKGMGLGLSLVYSVINRLNGHICVESEERVGTEIFIYLPSTGKPAIREKKKEEGKVTGLEAVAGIKRILFMDDEQALQLTTKKLLERVGYEVDVASNGEEAIQKYVQAQDSGKPFDAIILDLTIVGGMGGVETIKKLLQIDPEVRGIVASGYSTDPVIANYEEYGFKGSVTKPATRAQIVEVLENLC